ncbi:MAG: OmpA family protein [Myxococcales bacterium]|nr:OmpA family protein [Myxococcales bacterium]
MLTVISCLALGAALAQAPSTRPLAGRSATPGLLLTGDPQRADPLSPQLSIRTTAAGPKPTETTGPLRRVSGEMEVGGDMDFGAGFGLALLYRSSFSDTRSGSRADAVVGDLRSALRWSASAGPLSFGAAAELRAPALGRGTPDRWGLSPALRLMLGGSVGKARLLANLRGELDRSDSWLASPTPEDRLAFSVGRGTALGASVAASLPLDGFTPFLEMDLRVVRGAARGEQLLVGPGLRYAPTGSLTLELAAAIPLLDRGTSMRPLPPWSVSAGLAVSAGAPNVVETVREVALPPPPPSKGSIRGRVIDAKTGTGLPDVAVELVGATVPRALSEVRDGSFLIPEVAPGTVLVRASSAGFEAAEASVKVAAGQAVELSLPLVRKPPPPDPPARLKGVVVDASDRPLKATVTVSGRRGGTVTPVEGTYELDIPSGEARVEITAEGYEIQARTFRVWAGETVVYDAVLRRPAPLKYVVIKDDSLALKIPLHFASGKAIILPTSFPVVEEVATVLLLRSEIARLRIEGHTDERGGAEYNQSLSERRAIAVRQALIQRGVAAERLTAQGFGQSRPVASNKSQAGRALNRRVEFIIAKE